MEEDEGMMEDNTIDEDEMYSIGYVPVAFGVCICLFTHTTFG